MASLRPLLDRALHGWRAEGVAAAAPPLPPAPPQNTPSLTIIDRPGARQSFIAAGRALPPGLTAPDTALTLANTIFGGDPTARINADLRDAKGWTYGIGSGTDDARGPRLWQLAGSVEREHSGAAVAELLAEMHAVRGDRPPRQAELDRVVQASVNQVAARLEGGMDLLRQMADSGSDGRAALSLLDEPARQRATSLAAVRQAARDLIDPAALHWVIVGDWQYLHEQFRDTAFADTVVVRAR